MICNMLSYQSDTLGMKMTMFPLPIQKLMKMKNLMMQFSRLLLLRYKKLKLLKIASYSAVAKPGLL